MKYLISTLFLLSSICFADVTSLPGPIINAEWLAENSENVVILDVRKQTENYFKDGHIENAILVDTSNVRVTRTFDGKEITRVIPDRTAFDNFMEKHGVSNKDVVIITNEGKKPGDIAGSARLYWQLKVYGYEQVALLDGGNKAWVAALEDLTTDEPKNTIGTFTTTKYNSDILATTNDVKVAIKNLSATLIDTRSLRYHIGLSTKGYVYAPGHIPTSKNFPYDFLTPIKGKMSFLPISQIKNAFINMGIDPMKPSILYCNSAYECSSVWFVMHEIMGNKKVAIYDGALHEWTMDTNNPMTTFNGQ